MTKRIRTYDNEAGYSFAPGMYIDEQGRLGIGTPTPTSDLDVMGSLRLQHGVDVDEFSTDQTLSGNSESAVPVESAVKGYVDNKLEEIVFEGTTIDTSEEELYYKQGLYFIPGNTNITFDVIVSCVDQTSNSFGSSNIYSGGTLSQIGRKLGGVVGLGAYDTWLNLVLSNISGTPQWKMVADPGMNVLRFYAKGAMGYDLDWQIKVRINKLVS